MQINIFLLLFGGLQGILFSLFLARKKLFQPAYIFLLLYLAAMTLQLTLKVMSKIWLMEHWPLLYNFSHYLPVLYGPMAYLFVKYLLQHPDFSFKDLKHFIPALFIFSALGMVLYRPFTTQPGFNIFNPHLRLCILTASLLVYHLMALQLWQQRRQSLQHFFSDTTFVQLNWVKKFIVISSLTGIAVISALYLLYMYYPNGHQYRYGFVALSICIYWISYTALTHPAVFSIIKGVIKEQSRELPVPLLKAYKPPVKYCNSSISGEQVWQVCQSLEKLMAERKLFLQPDLTINQLAAAVPCTRHQLSQVLNETLQQSYYDYINGLRMEEAKNLLCKPEYQEYKIASIAYDAGFNSLSTFNEVFKKHTGKTPSQYKKEMLKEGRQQRV